MDSAPALKSGPPGTVAGSTSVSCCMGGRCECDRQTGRQAGRQRHSRRNHRSCNTEHSTKAKPCHYGMSAHHEAEVLGLGDTSFKHVQEDLSCHDHHLVALDGSVPHLWLDAVLTGVAVHTSCIALQARCSLEHTCTTSQQHQPARRMNGRLTFTTHCFKPFQKAACT